VPGARGQLYERLIAAAAEMDMIGPLRRRNLVSRELPFGPRLAASMTAATSPTCAKQALGSERR
jgi:hypothetical protein